MNELTLIINQNPGSIELNFEELERQLDNKLAEYKGAIFTEDSKVAAKREVASLRKLKKDIDDARKAVKREWMKPYECFEARMKRLMEKVDEPVDFINGQVADFEKKRVEEKKGKIKACFTELIDAVPEYAKYCPLEKIYNTKWENASTPIKAVKEEMEKKIVEIVNAVDAIRGMNSDKSEEALRYYLRSGNLSEAIAMVSKYEKDKAEILRRQEEEREAKQERMRQQEIERVRNEERAALAREQKIREEERIRAKTEGFKKELEEECGFISDELPFEQPSTITAYYKVIATAEELERVEMAFNSIGIYFERRDV